MKKLLFICIMLIVVISYSPFANAMSLVYLTPTPNALPGDINCDGVVNAEDALNILRYAVNPYGGNCAYAYWLGDVDGTRTVDAIDALYVLQLAVHPIQTFPVDRPVRLDNFQCSRMK